MAVLSKAVIEAVVAGDLGPSRPKGHAVDQVD